MAIVIAIQCYHLIKLENRSWTTSRMMQIPNASRTGRCAWSRIWRTSPAIKSSCHQNNSQRCGVLLQRQGVPWLA